MKKKSFGIYARLRTVASMPDIAFILAGFAVGLIVGLTGVGGGSLMTSTLGVALLLTAAAMLYKAARGKQLPRTLAEGQLESATHARHWSLPVLFGAVIGTLVTLTSVGAGAIGVSVLLLLFPLLPLPRIVAADIAYAVPLTLVAGLGHASMGSVDWPLLGKLLAGSLPGIWLGTRLMRHTPERLVRSALSVLLAYAGLKLIAL